MRLSIVAFAVLSIASASVVRAETPLTCLVDARSVHGGEVKLSTFDHSPKLPFNMPSRIFWQPPSSGDGIELLVGWQGDKAVGGLTGGHVMFTPRAMANAGRYAARVMASPGEIWTYGPSDLQFVVDHAIFVFDGGNARGRAILTAIDHGTPVTVDILLDGKVEQSNSFDPSNIKERDKLRAYADHLVEIKDPRVCKPI